MRFFKEADIVIEQYKEPKRKDVSRGDKMHRSLDSEGPMGISSPTVGKSEFGHFKSKDFTRDPLADTKAKSVRKSEIVLRNVFRILKGNTVFREKIDNLLIKYSKQRKQIRSDQEKVLSYNPAKIDELFTQILRLEKIIVALGTNDKRANQFKAELKEAQSKYTEYTDELEQVYDQMFDVIGRNEQASLEYQEKIIDLCQKTAHDEFNKLTEHISVLDNRDVVYRSFEEIEDAFIDDEQFDQDILRLEHLNLILSENEDNNPLFVFFELVNGKYQDDKGTDENFKRLMYNTHNVSVETLWNKLPTSTFAYLYNATKSDTPLRQITKGRRKQVKLFTPINNILDSIKTEEEYESYKYNLKEMILNMNLDTGRQQAVEDIIAGPFKRKGATAIQRLKGLLRGVLREKTSIALVSDDVFEDILVEYGA